MLVSTLSFAGLLHAARYRWPGDDGHGFEREHGHGIHRVLSRKASSTILIVELMAGMAGGHDPGPAPLPAPIPAPTSASGASQTTVPVAAIVDSADSVDRSAIAGYLPVRELDERPQLTTDIDQFIDVMPDHLAAKRTANFPADSIAQHSGTDTQSATALLLINEHGAVDKLVFEISGLPPELEAILRQRFEEARFLPGKLAGWPVRSALRIALRVQ